MATPDRCDQGHEYVGFDSCPKCALTAVEAGADDLVMGLRSLATKLEGVLEGVRRARELMS